MRHANLEAQAEGLFRDRHDARHLGLHLAALEVEAQSHRLPGRGQLPADDLHHAGQNRLLDVGQLAQGAVPALAAQQQIDDGRSQGQVQLQDRQRTQRLHAD